MNIETILLPCVCIYFRRWSSFYVQKMFCFQLYTQGNQNCREL